MYKVYMTGRGITPKMTPANDYGPQTTLSDHVFIRLVLTPHGERHTLRKTSMHRILSCWSSQLVQSSTFNPWENHWNTLQHMHRCEQEKFKGKIKNVQCDQLHVLYIYARAELGLWLSTSSLQSSLGPMTQRTGQQFAAALAISLRQCSWYKPGLHAVVLFTAKRCHVCNLRLYFSTYNVTSTWKRQS